MADTHTSSSKLPYVTIGQIKFIQRAKLYEKQKPYEVAFAPINVKRHDAKTTNVELQTNQVTLTALDRSEFRTDLQGFELDSLPTALTLEELTDIDTIQAAYHQEVVRWLKLKFNAFKVHIFDTTVSPASAWTYY